MWNYLIRDRIVKFDLHLVRVIKTRIETRQDRPASRKYSVSYDEGEEGVLKRPNASRFRMRREVQFGSMAPLVFYNFSDSLAPSLSSPFYPVCFPFLLSLPSFTFSVAVATVSLSLFSSLSLPRACCIRVHSPHARASPRGTFQPE